METKKIEYPEMVTKFVNYISTHAQGTINLTDEVSYNQKDVIKDNILDRNFKFSVPLYSDGDEKTYFSIPYILADAVYRNTDLDTKDIQIKSDNPAAIDWIPLIRGGVRNYLKTSHYEDLMNDIRKELIDMGHVITKEVDDDTKIVSLLNIVRPADSIDIQDGGCAEAVYMSWEQMQSNKEAWGDSWKEVVKLKEIMDSVQRKTFRVYEFWTIDKFKVAGEEKETKGCIKFLDNTMVEAEVPQDPANWFPYVVLEKFSTPYTETIKGERLKKLKKAGLIRGVDQLPIYPYEEQALIKVLGRWMGMGYYELLRNEGKAFNKTMNSKLRYDDLLHKGVTVHTKAPFGSNQKGSGRGLEADIMNRIQTGTMISIKAGEKIERLNLGTLTADFLATAEKWFELARQKVGISQTAVAQALPSSTPATTAVINEKQAKNAFDIVNEQQGIFFERLFSRFKIKTIIEALTQEEWTKIIGDPDELARMEEAFVQNLVNSKVQEAADLGKFVPEGSSMPPEELDKIGMAVKTMRARQGGQRQAQFKEFKDDLIKNFDFFISFYITDNSFDKNAILRAIQEAINSVVQNPMSELDADKLTEAKLDLMNLDISSYRKSPERIRAEREQAIAAAQGGTAVNPVESAAKTFGQNNTQTA